MTQPPSLFPLASPRSRAGARARQAPAREWWPITVGCVLLAIDPSIARCGWALLLKTSRDPIRLDSGIIYPKGDSECSRFDNLCAELHMRATRVVNFNGEPRRATDAVVEIPRGGGRGGKSMLDYARAVGICEAVCSRAGLSMNRVPANKWKGNQDKHPTQLLVKHVFRYEPADPNEADALGIGVWLCAQRSV